MSGNLWQSTDKGTTIGEERDAEKGQQMTSPRHQGGYCTPEKEAQRPSDLFVEYEIGPVL